MQLGYTGERRGHGWREDAAGQTLRRGILRGTLGYVLLAVTGAWAQAQSVPAPSDASGSGAASQPEVRPAAAPDAEASRQASARAGQALNDSPSQQRRQQITDESTMLLKLANDLKAEVDKTSKDTLSLSVIRKADEIEKLAHVVREKMKLSAGPNDR